MAALSDAGKQAWCTGGRYRPGVDARLTTSQLWDSVRLAASNAGLDSPGVSVQGINEIRSAAAAIRNAGEASGPRWGTRRVTGQATGDRLIHDVYGAVVAVAPGCWTLSPAIRVRFELANLSPEGEQVTTWLTNLYPGGALPDTVGDLIDSLGSYGQLSGSAPRLNHQLCKTLEFSATREILAISDRDARQSTLRFGESETPRSWFLVFAMAYSQCDYDLRDAICQRLQQMIAMSGAALGPRSRRRPILGRAFPTGDFEAR